MTAPATAGPGVTASRRTLFVATILAGSFLLFLVQPMVARMALPRLGGAPNVWNSAMLVYQALLLGGYAYAHLLGRLPLRRQAWVHIAVLLLAALTLPIALAHLPPPAAGAEVLWVPLLFLATIGPVFFAVSAQAPLMQRWYAADPAAGDPYPLYAASNLGSFAGLIAYPLLAEPLLPLRAQSAAWAVGYGVLVLLVILAARALPRGVVVAERGDTAQAAAPIGWRRIAMWALLATVPSGLMLSTTSFLTTDIIAMPLLWVIPLGLYLLSFTVAFAERRGAANLISRHAAMLTIVLGCSAMLGTGRSSLAAAGISLLLLFVVAVALHARLHALRPPASQLTLFYLVMSAGGALGGVLTALIAPALFDWTWEHPLLIVAAALLVPLPAYARWTDRLGWSESRVRLAMATILAGALIAIAMLSNAMIDPGAHPLTVQLLLALVVVLAVLVVRWRAAFAVVLALSLLALGGMDAVRLSLHGARSRSYFGVYTVRDIGGVERTLAHGTTLHGVQMLRPELQRLPTSYYVPTSGVGLALGTPDALPAAARVAVVGLGVGTLACYHRPGQAWTFYEIDPAVLALSRNGTFSFLRRCAPDARVVIGDARLELARAAPQSYDVLAIDAFSSDAVPLHLLTDEAFEVYLRSLKPGGLLLIHISNRFVNLAPAMGAAARANGLAAVMRYDQRVAPPGTESKWIAMARDPARLARLQAAGKLPWQPLDRSRKDAWTDDFASVFPDLNWSRFL